MKRKVVLRVLAFGVASVVAFSSPLSTIASYADNKEQNDVDYEDNSEVLNQASEQINEAKEAADDVVISIPLGSLDVKIPLETGVEKKCNNAEKIVNNTQEFLEYSENKVEEKLDESVTDETGTPVDVVGDDDESKIDDKTIDSLNSAEEYIAEGQDIIDKTLEDAYAKLETGFNSSEEATEFKTKLETAELEITEKLADAQAEYDKAKENYADAQKAYSEVEKISEDAASKAQKNLEKAQNELEIASTRANILNDRLLSVKGYLDNADEFLKNSENELDEKIEVAESNLDDAIEKLDESVENLKEATENLSEDIETLKEEIADVKEATEDFVDSVKTAFSTQKELEALYEEYDNAQKALTLAAENLDNAKALYGDDGGEKAYQDALDAYNAAMSAIENIKSKYDDIYEFNTELGKKITDEEYDAATIAIVDKYILKDGQTAKVITDGSEGNYDGNSYVAVYDGDGNVIRRYSYEFNEEDFSVKPLVLDSKGVVTLSDNRQFEYTADDEFIVEEDGISKTFTIKGSEGDYYYEGEQVDVKPSNEAEKIEITIHHLLKPDEVIEYKISKLKKKSNSIDDNNAMYFTYLNITYFVDTEGKIYTVDGLGKKKHRNYNIILFDETNIEYKNSVTIGDNVYTVTGDDAAGYSYKVGNETVNLVKSEDGNFFIKESVDVHEYDENEKKYSLSDETAKTKGAINQEYLDKYNEYQTKNDELTALTNDYESKNAAYQDYLEILEAFSTAKDEADRTDLTVTRKFPTEVTIPIINKEIDLNDYNYLNLKTEWEIGDLAELPRSVLDLIDVNEILNMDPVDREKVLEDLNNIINSDDQAARLTSIVDVISQMGGTDTQAYVALLVALGEDTTDAQLDKALADISKIPIIGNGVADAIEKVAKETGCTTPFQRDYAQAWKNALDAKVNVVVSGVILADEASEAFGVGVEVLKSGVVEGAAITDVTISALNVAVDGMVLGGLYTGNEIVKLADKLVVMADDYVSDLQKKTQEAADEVNEAKENFEKLKLTNPGSQELAKALVALQSAENKLEVFEKKLTKANGDLETIKEKAQEADNTAQEMSKKEKEEQERNNNNSNTNRNSGNDGTNSENGTDFGVLNNRFEIVQTVATESRTVLVASAARQVVTAQNEELEGEENVSRPEEQKSIEEKETAGEMDTDDENKTVSLEDSDTPLAATAQTEVPEAFNWWWIPVACLIVIGSVTVYGAKKKKTNQAK